MTDLQHPDALHFQAAIGWLELGSHIEANEELEKITANLRAHPDVLVVRWQIHSKAEQWELWYDLYKRPCNLGGSDRSAFQGEALRRLPGGEIAKGAWAALLPAADRFPKDWSVFYNLACYSCQMGGLADAWFLAGDGVQSGRPEAAQIEGP